MTTLEVADPVNIGATLSSEESAIAQTVRDFVTDHVLDHVGQWFEEAHFPARELAGSLGEIGLLGMHLHGYSCAGTSATAYGLACLELEAADSGLRSFVSVQGSLAMYPIHTYG